MNIINVLNLIGTYLLNGISNFLINLGLNHIVSRHYIFGKHRERETYKLVEKDHYYSNIILERSSIKNSVGFLNIDNNSSPSEVLLRKFAFANTYSNALFFIGKKMLLNRDFWIENIISNGNQIKIVNEKDMHFPEEIKERLNKKILKNTKSICVVKSTIENSPIYTSKITVYAKGIGIIYSKLVYRNKDIDEYILNGFKVTKGEDYWIPYNHIGNSWTYDINCMSKINPINMRQ